MNNDDSEQWAGLKTVLSFDNGENSSLAMGVTHKEPHQFSPSSLLVESLIDEMCKLMEKDPNHQKRLYMMICDKLHQMNLIDRSYDLDEFEFMRSHYRKALFNLLTFARASSGSREGGSGAIVTSKPCLNLELPSSSSSSLLEWSRYSNEFEELEFIARGGFGRVYKARHKLDGSVYAVKKINLRYRNATKFLHSLNEVKMLAVLHHPNIVAYKAAWLEPFDNRRSSSSISQAVIVDGISHSSLIDSYKNFEMKYSNDSSDIVFVNSNSTSSEEAKHESISKDNILSSESSSSSGKNNLAICMNSLQRFRSLNVTENLPHKDWATLFVQMQLCEDNMRQWIDERNRSFSPVDFSQSVAIFIKILKGIDYIHDRGIVHHDIKPSNIFISRDLRQVQVGDFGLACCLLTHQRTVPLVPAEPTEHFGRIGTKLYAAPEQINGVCDSKSDIYSMGIILLELITTFQTDMERSKVIQQLKEGKIPTELTASRPDLAKIISRAVSKSVSKRPSASELLKMIHTKERKDSECIIREKECEIRELREELVRKDAEILSLKQQLAAITAQPQIDS